MSESRLRASILGGVTMCAAVTLASCYPRSRTPLNQTTLPAVRVMRVTVAPVAENLALLGKLEPWRETTLLFEVPGVVQSVLVEEGERVAAGQPLAQLVPTDLQLAVAEVEANRDVAQAKLDLLLAGTHQDEIATAKAEYERARTVSAYWVSELKRIKNLVAEKAAPQGDLEVAQREHDAHQQQERAAEFRWKRALAGPRQQEIDAARAELRRLQHAVEVARQQLTKATLTAPFAGRIEKRFLDEGALVNVFPTGGVPVVHLVDLDQVDAVVAAPEMALQQLEGDTKVQVASTVQPDLVAEGTIVAIGSVADRATGTYEVRVRIPNATGRLRGGMVIRCRFPREETRHAIQIPVTAVQHAFGQPPFVYLLNEDSRVVTRNVALGEIDASHVEISRGLSAGESLIIGGQHRVIPGDQVRQIPAAQIVGRDMEPVR